MKQAFIPLIATACLFTSCTVTQPAVVQDNPPPPVAYVQPPPQQEATYQTFYDELAPYGNWIDYPDYGYVWQPSVDPSFEPYSSNGHWVYGEGSWTWVSGYSWGWAAFHYGRWFYEDGYGWLWLPGKEWAPAWVTWGQSGGYYGWAPLGPRVNANDNWTPPARSWTFVPQEHITKPNVHDYVVNKTNNVTIVKNVTVINNITNNNTTIVNNNHNTNIVNNNNTTTINNNNTTVNNHNVTNNNTTIVNNNVHNKVVFNAGPHITEVEKVTNVPVQKVAVNEHTKPAQTVVNNNNITIYRPVIKEAAPTLNRSAPRNVVKYQPRPKN